MSTHQHDILRRRANRRRRRMAEEANQPHGESFGPQTGDMLQQTALAHPTAIGMRQGALQRMQTGWGNAAVQRFLAEIAHSSGLAQREEGEPSAPADPGTSTHPTVKYGSRGPAVEELQQKLNADGASPALAVDGIFGPLTRAATIAFQQNHGLAADGIVGALTWGKIDELGLASTVGRVEKQWSEEVGGQTYGMTSRFTWRITDREILITVKLKFVGLKRPELVTRWFDHIRTIWNRFDAVGGTGERLAVTFDPQTVSSGEDNVVRIRPGEGRSDAGNWFAEDPDSDTTAAHEFGHMIGLEDEYQRTHADYKRLTGEEPKPGDEDADDPKDVAEELHTALQTEEDADRVDACTQVIQDHELEQGFYAQHIAEEYKKLYGIGLVQDIVNRIPDEDEWSIVDPFTFSSDSVMGIGGDHEHPVDPRHVRSFVRYVQQARGGTWNPEER